MRALFLFICVFFVSSFPAFATTEAQFLAEKPFSYATTSVQRNGAVFMSVQNNSGEAVKLVKASGDVAESVELHIHDHEGDVMMMRRVDHFDIGAGETLILEPMGNHIMLMGLKEQLTAGETFPITLYFEGKNEAYTLDVDVEIASLGVFEHTHGSMKKPEAPKAEEAVDQQGAPESENPASGASVDSVTPEKAAE